MNTVRRDVFQAIADPTRREIISILANKTLNLNAVAGRFDVSRPAISKHIKILTECGLVIVTQQGRERYCRAQLKQLSEVSDWVEKYRMFWTNKLDALEQFLTRGTEVESKMRGGKHVASKSKTKKSR